MLVQLFVDAFAEGFFAVKRNQLSKIQAIAFGLPKNDERWDEISAKLKTYFEQNSFHVFCVEDERKKGVSAAMDWIARHVVTRQDLIAAAICMGESFWTETLTVEAAIKVTYELNGENSIEVVRNLEKLIQRAIGEGILTGELDVTVANYDVNVVATQHVNIKPTEPQKTT